MSVRRSLKRLVGSRQVFALVWFRNDVQMSEALTVLVCNNENSDIKTKSAVKPENRKAAQEEASRIRWLLAINPNTPPPVLEHLARDEHSTLLERVAENPRTHFTTLARLSTHLSPQVRASVAENSNASIKTIWRLARDPNADVRLRLAESYTVPVAVLRVLAEDENPFVCLRAKETMKRILEEVHALRSS